jgi:hypothetical protein
MACRVEREREREREREVQRYQHAGRAGLTSLR